jgi:hypothetical protein
MQTIKIMGFGSCMYSLASLLSITTLFKAIAADLDFLFRLQDVMCVIYRKTLLAEVGNWAW